MEEEDEVFDLGTLGEYELLTNEDGSLVIQEDHVAIKHQENGIVKLLPLTEEVIRVLGLSVVNEEEEKKVKIEVVPVEENNEPMEQQEYLEETIDPLEETTNMSAASNTEDGQNDITIVFTDDEDAELCKLSNASKSPGDTLLWSVSMVNELLDLYETYQQDFLAGTPSHRKLWKTIHQAMCKSHPSLLRCTELHIQSKFNGLRRTYRGALEYLRNNLHTSRWPYFERMQKIMEKQGEKSNITSTEDDASTAVTGNGSVKDSRWLKPWTSLLLDAHLHCFPTREHSGHFGRVLAYMARADPRCRRLGQSRLCQKLEELRAQARRPDLSPDQLEPDVEEKLKRIEAMSAVDTTQDSDPDERAAKVWEPEPNAWPADCISKLLSTLAVRGGSMERVARELRLCCGEHAGWMSTAVVAKQVRKLRLRYQSLSGSRKSASWPHYEEAMVAFGPSGDAWGPVQCAALLEHYSQVARVLDDSGPKFWAELARRLNRSDIGFKTTSAKCEMKMQALCARYQNMVRQDPDVQRNAKLWGLFEKMHSIFGIDKSPIVWPSRATYLLLAAFQRELARLDGPDADQAWEDIARTVGEIQSEPVTGADCKHKLSKLKQKYCKVMNDEEAAKAWPLYKRMSELFSSPLWSKNNLHLLLNIYEELRERLESPNPSESDAAWHDVAERLNAAAASSCVGAAHCRTALHVLHARRRALRDTTCHSKEDWPFMQRMNEIFGSESEKTAAPEKETSSQTTNDDKCNVADEYVWTEDLTNHLLDSYRKNYHLFATLPRKAVWQRIERSLAKVDPTYSPEKKGGGAWFKYLDVMTKYMDIKEKRCVAKDWPFLERMEAIFNSQKKDNDTFNDVSEGSDRSRSASPEYRTEIQLQTPNPNRHRKRMTGDMDFQGVFIKAAKRSARMESKDDTDSEEVVTKETKKAAVTAARKEPNNDSKKDDMESDVVYSKETRKSARLEPKESVTAGDETSLRLLELYSRHLKLLQSNVTSPAIETSKARAWARIAKQLNTKDPRFSKTGPECCRMVEDLQTAYKKMKANKGRVLSRFKLSPKIFEKMKEISGDVDKNDNEEEEGDVEAILAKGNNSEVMRALLKETIKKNKISEQRNLLLKQQHKERTLQHAATMSMMKSILKALSESPKNLEENRCDILNMLEKTMEEIHK